MIIQMQNKESSLGKTLAIAQGINEKAVEPSGSRQESEGRHIQGHIC